MRARFDANGELKELDADLRGDRYLVYVDTDMLLELANGDAHRRTRFVSALRNRGTLLFSEANLLEVGRLAGTSAASVATFLTSIGPHWVPLRMSAFSVLESPDDPNDPGPASRWFLDTYYERRMQELQDAGIAVDKSSSEAFCEQFFDLGVVVTWAQDTTNTYRAHMDKIATAVINGLRRFRDDYERDPTTLDARIPERPYTGEHRLLHVVHQLLRLLIKEFSSHQLTMNDGVDLCHATMAAAYGSLITLDKAWKRRVEAIGIPPNELRVFYRPEAEALVATLEQVPDLDGPQQRTRQNA